jgi:SAM-dependent methyltransferase
VAVVPKDCDSAFMATDHFGAEVAARYDEDEQVMFTAEAVEPAVVFLAQLAGELPALELGIGTGRIALPLRERGVAVHGIDLSTAMVERLRAKLGGRDIPVVIGDFATASVNGEFGLAYIVFNTIGNLTSQAEQVACFRNVARHLIAGGHFVVEVGVPGVVGLPQGETARPFALTPEHVGLDEYDMVTQSLISHHFYRDGTAWRRGSTPLRYVWPSELDLMAELAGMTLAERWGDWDRSVFDQSSSKHVSVWQKW